MGNNNNYNTGRFYVLIINLVSFSPKLHLLCSDLWRWSGEASNSSPKPLTPAGFGLDSA